MAISNPFDRPPNSQFIKDATTWASWSKWFWQLWKRVQTGALGGTVTSVAVTAPVEFSVSGSPITTSGTIAITKANEPANTVWAGPTTGAAAQPAFRGLVAADLPAGTGTVTSVDVSGGTTGLTFSGGPITTSGTITLAGTLDADNGGTGFASYAVGDILYASTTTALSKLADVATGNALISGGIGVAPSWGKIGLTTHVSGTLPVANGGTGVTSSTGTSKVVLSSLPSFDTTIGVGGASASASGSGVSFPATQSASTDANTLDDYEEGTWTPILTFQTPGDLSITYAAQDGTYTKIGRLVTVTFDLVSSAFTHTTASGAVLISGLPFNCASPYHFIGAMIFANVNKATYTQCVIRARSTFAGQLEVLAQGMGVASANVVAADMASGGTVNFRGTLSYEV